MGDWSKKAAGKCSDAGGRREFSFFTLPAPPRVTMLAIKLLVSSHRTQCLIIDMSDPNLFENIVSNLGSLQGTSETQSNMFRCSTLKVPLKCVIQ